MKKNVEVKYLGWNNLSLNELKKETKKYYNANILGKSVVNKKIGITVNFNGKGIRHLIYARGVGIDKLVAVRKLLEIVENANFSNYKGPDKEDLKEIIGYYNFTCKVLVNGYVRNFSLSVRITKSGKFYYDHSVRVKK